SNRGIDSIFGYVASRPKIIVFTRLGGKASKLLLHLVGSLPRPDDYLTNSAHGLTVRGDDRARADVMKDVFGCNRFLADPALGEGHILANTAIQVMGDHQHVESFVEGICSIGARRGGR